MSEANEAALRILGESITKATEHQVAAWGAYGKLMGDLIASRAPADELSKVYLEFAQEHTVAATAAAATHWMNAASAVAILAKDQLAELTRHLAAVKPRDQAE
ncbi:hypothetical protein [Crossiella cryophila]|uniref:Phasin protein n=1 Tax=Crossiella cryophila TaxID=43355 RepID=A0A7W7FX14_9PSEU|nr:hypothetical protein [Crossiella cryophila]MBB4680645.1 hypothetical protein [Crossiella cryophila]